MRILSQCVAVSMVLVLSMSLVQASGAERSREVMIYVFDKSSPSHCHLCLINGEVGFVTTNQSGRPPKQPAAAPLPDYSRLFVQDGKMLRVGKPEGRVLTRSVKVGNEVRTSEKYVEPSKELVAKTGWYLTADYSTTPPRVVLTKKPTKTSAWEFVHAKADIRDDEASAAYIKNINGRGMAVWLSVADKPIVYKDGSQVRNLTLASVKKTILVVVEANGGR